MKNKKGKTICRRKEDTLEFIKNKKYIVISGEREFGKTALMKQLYKEFLI